jgi:hypothetical protein
VGSPIVGDYGGRVLGRHEVLERGDAGVGGFLALLKALLQALPALDGARVLLIHPLEQFVERLGDDRVHSSPCPLQPVEVLVGDRLGSRVYWNYGFDIRREEEA